MEMYIIDETELEEDDRVLDGRKRRLPDKGIFEPKRSPIRRKDKMRQEKEIKPKAKRNQRKVLNRIKYEWKDD